MTSLFLCNIHLGGPHNNTDNLFKVLQRREWDTIFLVGNFLDLESLNEYGELSPSDQKVLRWVAGYIRKGGNVVWVLGDKDLAVQAFYEQFLGTTSLTLTKEYCKNGLYVVHGRTRGSLSIWQKLMKFLGSEKRRILRVARQKNCKRIITGCGTKTRYFSKDKMRYFNCGDWSHNSTWIEEYNSGNVNIFKFDGEQMVVWGI